MTSSYRDPNVAAALAYQAEQEQRRKAQEQPNLLDIAGRTALGLGAATLAGVGVRGLMRRNAVRPINVEDLGATAARAEENVRRAARSTATPPPSRPAPPAGVARQQAVEEFTRQARAERPAGIQQVNIQDLGPTFRTPSAAENKATLAFFEDVVLPTEQALTRPRLSAAGFSPTDYLTQKGYVEAAATGTPYSASEVAQLSRRPLIDAADRLLEDTDLLKRVEAEEAALVNVQPEMRGEQSRQQSQVRRALSAQADEVIAGIRSEPVGTLVSTQQARTGFNVDQAINALDAAEDQQTGRIKIQLQRNEDLDLGQVEVLEDIASQQRNSMLEMDEPINRVASQLPDGIPVDQTDLTSAIDSQEFADIARNEMIAKRQALAASGMRGERLERALGRTPSSSVTKALEAVSPIDLEEAPLQERTLINVGPGAQIEKAASGTSIRGTSRIGAVAAPQQSMRQIGGPDYVLYEGRPVYTVNAPVEMSQDIPGSRRQLPPPVERVDEYALKSDLGGGIGIYGVEPAFAAGAIRKDLDLLQIPKGRTPLGISPGTADPMISTTEAAGKQPSNVPKFTEKDNPFRDVSTNAIQQMAGAGTGSQAVAAQRELNRRTRNPEGLAISEAMRRTRIEGRDPQVFLDKLMKERGISSASGASSPLR